MLSTNMNLNGNLLLKALIVEFVILAGVYFTNKDWPRFIYWLGSVFISVGVLTMK